MDASPAAAAADDDGCGDGAADVDGVGGGEMCVGVCAMLGERPTPAIHARVRNACENTRFKQRWCGCAKQL